MVATAFLSGLFGMAGGMILIGVLLMLMPLPTAMVLHAITQMGSKSWRAFLWRGTYPVAAGIRLSDRLRARARRAWSIIRYVPDKPIALLLLGVTPVHGAADAEEPQTQMRVLRKARSTASSAWV